MKQNNKALYEKIMRNVAKEVKKTLTQLNESWGGLSPEDDEKWNKMFDEFVPSEGKCDTVGGEILRAMSRIVYRWYNDGDTVDEYYGSEHNLCKGANYYLMDNVPGFESLESHNLAGYSKDEYDTAVCERLKFVFDYLVSHPEVFETPNDVDFIDLAPFEPWVDDEEDDDDGFWDDPEYNDEY